MMTHLELKKMMEELIVIKENNSGCLIKGNDPEIKQAFLECKKEMNNIKNKIKELEELDAEKERLARKYNELHEEEEKVFSASDLTFEAKVKKLKICDKELSEIIAELENVIGAKKVLNYYLKAEKFEEKNSDLSGLWEKVQSLYYFEEKTEDTEEDDLELKTKKNGLFSLFSRK